MVEHANEQYAKRAIQAMNKAFQSKRTLAPA